MTFTESSILVVDDEPILRLTFSIVLKQVGAKVHSAGNGLQALDVLEREHVDLILSDKQMPEMDGITMLHELVQRGIRLPTVFFVNGVDGESPELMERLGVVKTVTKPLHPTELLRLLQNILEPMDPVQRAVQ